MGNIRYTTSDSEILWRPRVDKTIRIFNQLESQEKTMHKTQKNDDEMKFQKTYDELIYPDGTE